MWEKIKEYFKHHSTVEKKKLSEMTFKEKAEYVWEYYKIHIIAAAVVIIIAWSFINAALNPPVPPYAGVALYEIFLGEEFNEEFTRAVNEELVGDARETLIPHLFVSGDDPTAQMVVIQKFMAMITTKELDLFIAEIGVLEEFIGEDLFFRFDQTGLTVPEDRLIYGSTPDNPESLAYAVNLKGSSFLNKFGVRSEALAAGIIINTPRFDNAVAVLNFLLE